MQNINPTTSRNRRALFYLSVMGFPGLIGGCLGLVSIPVLIQFPMFGNSTTLMMVCLTLFGIPAFIAGGIGVYRGLTLAKDNELAYQVGESMKSYCDGRYTYIRNISRRGLGYIDAVIIGPPGALVLRVVDYGGTWRNERAEWLVKDAKSGKMRPAPSNPSRECARDVYALRKYLTKHNLDKIPVYGAVVFISNNLVLQGAGPIVPISEPHRLQEVLLRDYLADENRITPAMARAAIDAITK